MSKISPHSIYYLFWILDLMSSPTKKIYKDKLLNYKANILDAVQMLINLVIDI